EVVDPTAFEVCGATVPERALVSATRHHGCVTLTGVSDDVSSGGQERRGGDASTLRRVSRRPRYCSFITKRSRCSRSRNAAIIASMGSGNLSSWIPELGSACSSDPSDRQRRGE